MRVNVRKLDDIVVVDLDGRLVTGTGAELLNEVLNELLAQGWKKIVVNLDGVTRIDSSGLGEIVAGTQLAERLGSVVGFVKPHRRVHKVLEIARILPALKIYHTEAEAIAAFG